jgi:hypothetical protein
MCTIEARVKSDDGDPSGDETGILACQHALSRPTSCAEQEIARSFLGRPKLAFYRLAGLLAQIFYDTIITGCAKGAMMKTILSLAVVGMLLVTPTAMTAFAASKTNRVSVRYVLPKNPAHQPIYKDLKERRALEKLQEFLSPFRLPRTLKFSVAGCDGEDDAFYGDDAITICYEYVDKLWKNMPAKATAAGIAPIDTVIGPFVDTSLHEFAHALFDMLNLPVFGRVEDAADQVAAYIILQFGKSEARRLIIGTAFAYETDEKRTGRRRSMEDYASEHGTPAQRAFNVLCIAYGADRRLFHDIVRRGYLPKSRAEYCDEEYEQVQDAFEKLVYPHMDLAVAEKVLDRNWLCPGHGKEVSERRQDCVLVPDKKPRR